MFYSETLLSKTGPLARVWLSANLERKLSKNHILQASVKDSVEAIVTPNQAPMALRLSGQLLLGVVRIYSRKARYLLDDCNEALMKIKMVCSFNLRLCILSNIVSRHFAFLATMIYRPAFTCHLEMLLCSQMCSLRAITLKCHHCQTRRSSFCRWRVIHIPVADDELEVAI